MHPRNNTYNFFEIILRIMQHKELLLMMCSLCVLSCFAHLKCLPPHQAGHLASTSSVTLPADGGWSSQGEHHQQHPNPLSLMPPIDQSETTELQKECEWALSIFLIYL